MRKDGSSLYEHLRQVEITTGEWPEQYIPVVPSPEHTFIWDLWIELRANTNSTMGISKIKYTDIYYYEQVMQIKIPVILIDIIFEIDDAYLAVFLKIRG